MSTEYKQLVFVVVFDKKRNVYLGLKNGQPLCLRTFGRENSLFRDHDFNMNERKNFESVAERVFEEETGFKIEINENTPCSFFINVYSRDVKKENVVVSSTTCRHAMIYFSVELDDKQIKQLSDSIKQIKQLSDSIENSKTKHESLWMVPGDKINDWKQQGSNALKLTKDQRTLDVTSASSSATMKTSVELSFFNFFSSN